MRHPISSLDNSSVISYNNNEAGYAIVDRRPINAVFSSAQSPHVANVEHDGNTNLNVRDLALQCVFSGARARSFRTCLAAQNMASAQAPVEMLSDDLVSQDIGVTTSSNVCLDLIQGQHFQEWSNYNIRYDSSLESRNSAPPEMNVHLLWHMLNGQQGQIEDRANEFARMCNINPLAWSLLVIFNGKPVTFLPRYCHHNSQGPYYPITTGEVITWQDYDGNRSGLTKQASFAIDHSIFRGIIDVKDALTPGRALHFSNGHMKMPIFSAPELLGISDASKERITAQHFNSWERARLTPDYGIMSYLSFRDPGRLDLSAAVLSWRDRQRCPDAVLTPSVFAHKHKIDAELWKEVVAKIADWDGMSEFAHLHFAMHYFCFYYSLDDLLWHFLAWSNELNIRQQSGDKLQVQEVMRTLFVLQQALRERVSHEIWPDAVRGF